MSVMGIKIDQFDVPVCNSFRPKIIKDQLCYTVDPNGYKNLFDKNQEISVTLYINYNEDRVFSADGLNENHDENFIFIGTKES